ncbi:hypothetical protein JX266_014127 [Neoarthrinium moseri]|nr:hypothetical protein JX266_014127 [Neoarthrinium moseri]
MSGFALMIAILEVLFAVSQWKFGLSGGVPPIRYLWTYGTTGILTLAAAFWHRMDYETKVSAPWLKASPVTASKVALLVDYVDTWSLLVPFRALRNQDHEVACSSTISLLLQVLIVLSTALFALAPTDLVNNIEPIILTSRFVDDPARLKDNDSLLPYYIAMGTEPSMSRINNLSNINGPRPTYPEGCTNQFAYQTFYPASPSLMETKATVDGLALGLACERVDVGRTITMPRFRFLDDGYIMTVGDEPYFEVSYRGCKTTIQWDIFTSNPEDYIWVDNNETFREHGMMLRVVPGFASKYCNSTDQDAHRLVFVSVDVEWRSINQTIISDGKETTIVNLDAAIFSKIFWLHFFPVMRRPQLMLCLRKEPTSPLLELQPLWMSANQQGLMDADVSKYLLYAWTIVPATIGTIISWWLSSIDTQVRLLTPYNSLKRDRCSRGVLQVNLLRGLMPSVLYQELKTSNFPAVSTTLAALLGASLTTVSAAMFRVITYPVSSPVKLLPNTVFITPTPRSTEITYHAASHIFEGIGSQYVGTSRLSSLLLETNLSYSQRSFQNLVFPTFSMAPLEIENVPHTSNASSASIRVAAPALRPRLSCRVYSQSDITAVYKLNYSVAPFLDLINGITVDIPLKGGGGGGGCSDHRSGTTFFETGKLSECLFAAATATQFGGIQTESWDSFLYIWGYHDSSPGYVTNISAVGCNNTMELVDTTFSFFGPDLHLDLSDTPQIIESTARDIPEHGTLRSFTRSELYKNLASLPTAHNTVFDPFFQQLVTSRYAIPVSAIGDPTQSETVMDAIRFQHGIIEAQFLSANYRIDINSSNVTENATNVLIPTLFNDSTSGDPPRFPATVRYPFGRQRIVQDPIATALLEALLLSILILSVVGWWLSPREPALPRSPSSVGSLLALLAGGNVLEHIYDGGPEPLCWEDVETRLGEDSRFYLGWDPSNPDEKSEKRRFGIWIVNQRGRP